MENNGKVNQGKVKQVEIVEEMQTAYLDYAMSVIMSRAIPDARDGLKPVHRRILVTLNDLKLTPKARFRKAAKICGDVSGNYHPHGESIVYPSLALLAQDFKMRYPLVDGQGNWGSIDGDSPAAMRYCLTGDALVLTNNGLEPIRDIIRAKGEKTIDIEVLNYQGNKVKADKLFNSGKHKIIKLLTEQGYALKGTKNHPVLCWGLNDFGFPTLFWKLLEEVTKDDYLVLNRGASLFSKKNSSLRPYWPKNNRYHDLSIPSGLMNKDLAFLLGALVAEGSYHQDQIRFNNKDRNFYQKVRTIIKEQFPGVKLYERHIKGDCEELSIYQQKLVRFLEAVGLARERSDKKIIPKTILVSGKEVIRSFLIGLFEGDGSVGIVKNKTTEGSRIELCYHSKSRELIFQLKVLLLNFGITSTAPYKDKRNDCYKLLLSGVSNIKRFKEEIGFFSEKKQSRLAEACLLNDQRMSKTDKIPFLNHYLRQNYTHDSFKKYNFDRYNRLEENFSKIKQHLRESDKRLIQWLLNKRYYFNKVKSVRELPKKEIVYSIRVKSSCHSFVANGFINHNTEARMTPICQEMLADLEKKTVDFRLNYDSSRKEPAVLPARIPQLLLNGTMGIAVGMATNIPPHNLGELVDALSYLVKYPKATTSALMQFVKGPDFPTGGLIYNQTDILEAYETGRGGIVMRGKVAIEGEKSDKGATRLIVTEIPFQVNKSLLVEKIASLVREKRVEGIRDVRDESDRDGMRVVVELKRDAFPEKILNRLYSLTDLQKRFNFNMLALVDGLEPRVLSLKEILAEFLKHRRNVVTRRAKYDLQLAEERLHILEGLDKALQQIDAVIQTIRKSKDKAEAKESLIKSFELSDKQSEAILELRLQSLASLERQKVKDELQEKRILISELKKLLGSEEEIDDKLIEELKEVKNNYNDPRRTKVQRGAVSAFKEEDLIANEETIITATQGGYIKRINPKIYRVQHRGGKGIIGMTTRGDDIITHFIASSTHDRLLFFTSFGRVFEIKSYEIPEGSRTARGQALVNFLGMSPAEKVTAILVVSSQAEFLMMATKNGIIKKIRAQNFANVRRSGIKAIKLSAGDELKWVRPLNKDQTVILVSSAGQSIRFQESDARAMTRGAGGVKGISLKKNDYLVFMDVIKGEDQLLVISANGYGKKTSLSQYKSQKRGGKGIKTLSVNNKIGRVVSGLVISGDKETDLVVTSECGQVIRIRVSSVSKMGRATQGVRLMKLGESDKVVSIVKV